MSSNSKSRIEKCHFFSILPKHLQTPEALSSLRSHLSGGEDRFSLNSVCLFFGFVSAAGVSVSCDSAGWAMIYSFIIKSTLPLHSHFITLCCKGLGKAAWCAVLLLALLEWNGLGYLKCDSKSPSLLALMHGLVYCLQRVLICLARGMILYYVAAIFSFY